MDIMSYLMGRNSGGGGKGATIEVVTELPETGESNIIYLVPKQDTGDNDVFDEYIWINDDWELIGTTDIDLSNYLAKDNTTSYTPIGDYNPATKKYVDDAASTIEVQALRSIAGTNSDTKFHYYVIDFNASGQPTLGSSTLKPAIINIMNDYIKHYDSNYTHNHIVIEIKTTLDNMDCTATIENWGSSAQMNSSQAYVVYPGFYTREMLRFTYNDGICTDYTSTTTVYGTTNNTYPILKNNTYAYTPTSDYNPATKKYVDDAVASAGSSVPTITITASQIVSQDPIQISLTAEQQAIIEDVNIGTLIIDGSTLGVTPAYCQKNEDGSTDILLAAFSFAWSTTSGFNISNTAIFAGYYDKQTHILTIVNTPLLGNTPTADNELANKKYVDDAVAGAAGGNAFPTYTIDLDTIIYANGLVLSATDNAKFSNAFTDAYSKGYKSIQILINYRTNQSASQYVYQNLMLPGVINGAANMIDITTKPGGYSFQSVINNNGELTFPGDKTQMNIMFSTLSLTLNWSGDVCSVTNARHYQTSYVFPLLSGVLYKTNTMAYTPMSNYHPATKLYTDLSVVKASGLLPYATNKTYQLGDYIYRSATDPTLYKCKVATTSGSWVAANWEQKTYMEYLSDTLVGGALNGSY